MLYYDRIDISEGIDLAKGNNSKECMICHYWFFNHGFSFQDSVCNGCHDLTMLSVNISDIAIITDKNVDYHFIINNISKSEAINSLRNFVFEDHGYILKNIVLNFSLLKTFLFFFFSLFSICKIVDSMGIYKCLDISIRTVMKNQEMLKLVL